MEKKLSSLSVFFPAYNEADNLPQLLTDALRVIPTVAEEYEIIVVNDGSQDTTIEVVQSFQTQSQHIKLVNHTKNQGYGAALKTGIAAASMDWIFFTDADQQFDLAELANFVPLTLEYDIILGFRQNRADSAQRRLNARLFKLYIDLLFRVHVTDIDCAFKLMRRSVVQPIKLESSGAFTTSELLYKLKKKGIKFKELAVSHYPRKFGTQTGANLKVVVKAGWEALSLYLSIKRHKWFGMQ